MITHNPGDLILMSEGHEPNRFAVLLRVIQPVDLSIVDKLTGPMSKVKSMGDFVDRLVGLGFLEYVEYYHIDTGPLDHIDLESIAHQARESAK